MSTRLLIKYPLSEKLAGEEGFEPSHRDPESRVLPLDDSPATDVRCDVQHITESKSSPLAGIINAIIPLKLPLKLPARAKKVGTAHLINSQVRSLGRWRSYQKGVKGNG